SYVAICRVGGYDFGVVVDKVYDTEEIVVKPVSSMLKAISVYAGNTILGDGSVIMILDPNGIIKAMGSTEVAAQTSTALTAAHLQADATISFLLLRLEEEAPKAVPLELISRLEEIDVSTIEC